MKRLPKVILITDEDAATHAGLTVQGRLLDTATSVVTLPTIDTDVVGVMVRNKTLPWEKLIQYAGNLIDVARSRDVDARLFFALNVGDEIVVEEVVDVVDTLQVDAIHLPARTLSEKVMSVMGDIGVMVGTSCHSLGDLTNARSHKCDYATLSPIFLTQSKPGYGPALGLDMLKKGATDAHTDGGFPKKLAVYGLGGISLSDIGEVCQTSECDGVAIMGDWYRQSIDVIADRLSNL